MELINNEKLQNLEEFRENKLSFYKKLAGIENTDQSATDNLTQFEEIINYQEKLTSSIKKHLPKRTKELIINLEKFQKPIAIVGLGDLHLGSTGVNYEALIQDVKTIKQTKGMFAVCLGDWLQNFIHKKLSNAGWGDLRPQYQWVLVELLLKTLADTMIIISPGNHDLWTQELTDIDKMEHLANKANICYNNDESPTTVIIDYGNVTYKGVFRHKPIGSSRINPMLGTKNIYRDLMQYDFCMTGHHHTFGIEHFLKHDKTRIALACGSFKTDDRFSKKCGYPDAKAIMPTVILMPKTHEILAFENIQTAAKVLNILRKEL